MEQKIKMRIREEERNLFKEDRERRYKMEKRSRMIIILSVVLAAVLAASLLTPAILVGSGGVTLAQHMELFQQKVSDLAGFAAGETPQNLVNFTLYRYLVIAAVGAGLALSGAVYQGSFKNALASPSTLGVQSGGTLGGNTSACGKYVSDRAIRAEFLHPFRMFCRCGADCIDFQSSGKG